MNALDMDVAPQATVAQIEGALVASVQSDLSPASVAALQTRLLQALQRQSMRGVLLDLSEVGAVDLEGFAALCRLREAVRLMGAAAILVGLRPGLVLALALLDADLDALEGAADIEQGLEMLASSDGGGRGP